MRINVRRTALLGDEKHFLSLSWGNPLVRMCGAGTWTGTLCSEQVCAVSYPLGLYGDVRRGGEMGPIHLN